MVLLLVKGGGEHKRPAPGPTNRRTLRRSDLIDGCRRRVSVLRFLQVAPPWGVLHPIHHPSD
jgi:hypothetical protein